MKDRAAKCGRDTSEDLFLLFRDAVAAVGKIERS